MEREERGRSVKIAVEVKETWYTSSDEPCTRTGLRFKDMDVVFTLIVFRDELFEVLEKRAVWDLEIQQHSKPITPMYDLLQ